MGWSITSDASIDGSGNASFPKNETSDYKEYTITYTDDDGCAGSTTYKVPPCELPPCECTAFTVTGKTDISKDGGSSITIGTLSKASCMSNPRASSSESWLSSLSVSGNDIKATVEANSSASSRNGSVTVTVDKDDGGTCDKTMTITQSAGGGETKDVTINYTCKFMQIEKGSVKNLKIFYGTEELDTIDIGGGSHSTSGQSTGHTKVTVPTATSLDDIVANLRWSIIGPLGYIQYANAVCGTYNMEVPAWDDTIAEYQIGPDTGDACTTPACMNAETYVVDGSFCYMRVHLSGGFVKQSDGTITATWIAQARGRD